MRSPEPLYLGWFFAHASCAHVASEDVWTYALLQKWRPPHYVSRPHRLCTCLPALLEPNRTRRRSIIPIVLRALRARFIFLVKHAPARHYTLQASTPLRTLCHRACVHVGALHLPCMRSTNCPGTASAGSGPRTSACRGSWVRASWQWHAHMRSLLAILRRKVSAVREAPADLSLRLLLLTFIGARLIIFTSMLCAGGVGPRCCRA